MSEFTVLIPLGVEGPDPHTVASSVSRSVLRSAFETLVDREHGFGAGLALDWRLDDGNAWVMRLRPGVRCHDGEPFTADAVVASCRRFVDPSIDNIMAGALAAVRGIEAVDELTVRFVTGQPTPALPLALGRVPMMSAGSVDRGVPAGTGPFRLLDVAAGEAELTAFADYWRGAPTLDSVRFELVPDAADRLERVRAGAAQLATNLDPSVLQAPPDGVSIVSRLSMLSTAVMLNLERPELADTRVRRAANLAVDLDRLIEDTLCGGGAPLASPVGPEYFGHDPELRPYPYDPERAKALLAEAGIDQRPLELAVPEGRYPRAVEVAEALVASLRAIGMPWSVRPLDWSTFVRGITEKSHDAFYMQISTMATERLLANEFSSRVRGIGWHHYRNDAVDELVERAAATLADTEREQLVRRALGELHDDPPWIFLFNQADVYGLSPRVRGWQPLANGFIDLSTAELAA